VALLNALQAIHNEAISLITTRLAQLGKYIC
jgi:hypothetical protein